MKKKKKKCYFNELRYQHHSNTVLNLDSVIYKAPDINRKPFQTCNKSPLKPDWTISSITLLKYFEIPLRKSHELTKQVEFQRTPCPKKRSLAAWEMVQPSRASIFLAAQRSNSGNRINASVLAINSITIEIKALQNFGYARHVRIYLRPSVVQTDRAVTFNRKLQCIGHFSGAYSSSGILWGIVMSAIIHGAVITKD